jgi:hypothetical protein
LFPGETEVGPLQNDDHVKHLIEVRDADDLDPLSDLVHDYWFDVENVHFDSDEGIVTVPLRNAKKADGHDRILKFHHVRTLEVEDEAMIASYDVDEIEYDPSSRRLVVASGFPFRMVMEVDALRVLVDPFLDGRAV